MKASVTLVTAPDSKSARKLADALVEEGLAACVTIVPGVTSTYRWKGKIHRDREQLLLIKSRSTLAKHLGKRIRELHPYEVPEILHLEPKSGERRYMKWLFKETQS